jgi:serine/threonine protein kinase
MTQFHPKPFGKYFLIDKLATGGMAEIYKAKTFGVDGFEKLLAIKRILPHCSSDKEFISMLIDEAKLSVLLSHTNIVQVYDLGKVGEDYFISMEFINGINLREVMNRTQEAEEQPEKLTEDVAVYIMSEVCKGLDYAHSKKDTESKPLNIIHRDISPQNILLSFEGEVKIVDFGIAKAAMNISHTMAGILKGKISYMSPEQALGKPIDHRTDIFSTGLMLYELLTGMKLFTGDTQFEVLKKIRTTRLTEKSFPSTMSESLRKILAKALAYSTKERYANAGDFQIDLTRYLYTTYIDFTPRKLAQLMNRLFAPEIERKSVRKVEEPPIDSQTRSVLITASRQQNIVHRTAEETMKGPADKQPTQTFIESFISGKEVPESTLTGHVSTLEDEEQDFEELTPTPTTAQEIALVPEAEEVEAQYVPKPPTEAAVPGAKKKKRAIWAVPLAALLLIGAGLGTYFGTDLFKPKPPPVVIKGEVQIQSNPPGAQVFLNDTPTERVTPATLKDLEVGQPQKVTLKKPKFKDWTQVVTLPDANPMILNPSLEVIPVGMMKVATTPAGAKIYLDGQDTGKVTPANLEELPLSQTYTLKLELAKHRPVEEKITVYSIEPIDFNKKLEEIIYGSIRVASIPPGARVFLNNTDTGLNTPVVLPDLEAGNRYNLRLAREGYRDVYRSVDVVNAQPLSVSERLAKIDEKTPEQIAAEKQRQLEAQKLKAAELEKQRQADLEKQRLAEIERQKQQTPDKQKQAELEKQRQALLEKQKQAERERLKQAELEKQRQAALDKQTQQDKEKTPETPAGGDSYVSLSSEPKGAEVFINGVRRGSAPGKFKVAAGTPIEVTITKSGLSTVTKTVNLRPGETRSLGTIQLGGSAAEGAGIIMVDSNPPGAMVFLDGSPQKSTPVRIRGLRPETTHTITVKKDGYKDWATSFTVGTGSKSFMANLKKM